MNFFLSLYLTVAVNTCLNCRQFLYRTLYWRNSLAAVLNTETVKYATEEYSTRNILWRKIRVRQFCSGANLAGTNFILHTKNKAAAFYSKEFRAPRSSVLRPFPTVVSLALQKELNEVMSLSKSVAAVGYRPNACGSRLNVRQIICANFRWKQTIFSNIMQLSFSWKQFRLPWYILRGWQGVKNLLPTYLISSTPQQTRLFKSLFIISSVCNNCAYIKVKFYTNTNTNDLI